MWGGGSLQERLPGIGGCEVHEMPTIRAFEGGLRSRRAVEDKEPKGSLKLEAG